MMSRIVCPASSLLRSCQKCTCSATRPVARRSFVGASNLHHHNRIPSSAVHSIREQDEWTAKRPFHSSHCARHNKNDTEALDSTGTISQSVDESSRNDMEKIQMSEDDLSHLKESFTDVPGATNTKGKKLAIVYTCKVCNTRSAKQFTEQAYHHGVVLVRCPGCQNLHLIADRLGWFDDGDQDKDGYDVAKVMAKAGENVKAVSGDDVLELTLSDITGSK